MRAMPGRAISTWTFVLGLVKWGRHVLLVQVPGDARWSVPGGRVEEGESLVPALQRLVREQAGLEVELEGVLRLEYTAIAAGGTPGCGWRSWSGRPATPPPR
jgi:8-oxo-dGTP pyrophosphatase MutT (NUDIX family)